MEPTLERNLAGHKNAVTSVSFNPTSNLIASGSGDSCVMLWNLNPQSRNFRLIGHKGVVTSVKFSPDGDILASSSKDKTVRLWVPNAKGESVSLKGHTGSVRTVAFGCDGRHLLTGSDDKTAKIWNLPSRKFACSLIGHTNCVRSAKLSLDSSLVVTGSDDKSVKLWDLASHDCLHSFYDNASGVNSVEFHKDGSCIAAGSTDRTVRLWDCRSYQMIQLYSAHSDCVTSISFHPSGNYLLSASLDSSLRIWDLRQGTLLHSVQVEQANGHAGAVNAAEFSADGRFFASGGSDRLVMVWKSYLAPDSTAAAAGMSELRASGAQIEWGQKDAQRPRPAPVIDVRQPVDLSASAFAASLASLVNPSQRANRTSVTPNLPPAKSSAFGSSSRRSLGTEAPVNIAASGFAAPSSSSSVTAAVRSLHPSSGRSSKIRAPNLGSKGSSRSSSGGTVGKRLEIQGQGVDDSDTGGGAAALGTSEEFPTRLTHTLDQIVNQLHMITQTMSIMDRRLVHTETRISDVAAQQSQSQFRPPAGGPSSRLQLGATQALTESTDTVDVEILQQQVEGEGCEGEEEHDVRFDEEEEEEISNYGDDDVGDDDHDESQEDGEEVVEGEEGGAQGNYDFRRAEEDLELRVSDSGGREDAVRAFGDFDDDDFVDDDQENFTASGTAFASAKVNDAKRKTPMASTTAERVTVSAKEIDLTALLEAPVGVPVYRRDNKDRQRIARCIEREAARASSIEHEPLLATSPVALRAHLKAFAAGAWHACAALGDLAVFDSVAYNKRASADPDHWYEINTANCVLFDNLQLRGLHEILPGRLFSTRMPRGIVSDRESAAKFAEKVRTHSLHTVLILAETEEYAKYAGADLEAFYGSLGLEVIHRPIIDFSLPQQPDLIEDIKDITIRLSEGQNCLVHCAGGSGRTGMVIAGIAKNVGIKDPIAWVRRVKTVYVETEDQEHFVNNLPTVLDERIVERHPTLAKAIAAEHILDTVITGKVKVLADEHGSKGITEFPISQPTEQQRADFASAFDLLDEDHSGFLSLQELEDLFTELGADVTHEQLTEFFALDANSDGLISKAAFIELMAVTKATHH